MLESDIRELRDDLNRSVDVPPFEALVDRGRRRRRHAIAGIAAVGVLAVGAALGVGQVAQQRADTPPVSHSNEPSGPGSADDIVDADQARLLDYEYAGDGRALSQWGVDCADQSCAAGLAWTTDDWASRETRLLDEFVNVELLADGLLVYRSTDDKSAYVLSDEGVEIDIEPPTTARPVRKDEVVIYAGDPHRFVALDSSTGRTHKVLGLDSIDLELVDKLPDGELRAYGTDSNDLMVYLSSSDGGQNWTEHKVPMDGGSAGLLSTEDNVVISVQGLEGVELLISNDAGRTWHDVTDLPFGGVGCMNPLDDGRLLLNQGAFLYASTDSTWRHFEKVEGAPEVSCLGHSFLRPTPVDVVTAVTSDQSGALMSTDNGDTWTEVDPR